MATMQTRSTNSKNLGKDGNVRPIENYLTATATISYITKVKSENKILKNFNFFLIYFSIHSFITNTICN